MLLYKIIKKLKLHKWGFRIIRPFCSHIIPITDLTVSSAEQKLQAIHPDRGATCLCKNTTHQSTCYDLQIVIPAYNASQYIVECMESVLSQQTKFRFVVTVVNDGSTDNTLQLLQRYTTNPNVILFDQENRGFSGARNRALENLIAPYVLFVDSDDRLPPNAIEVLMQTAKKEQAEIVEGSYRYFTNDKTISIFQHCTQTTNDWRTLHGFVWGKVFRSEFFNNIHFPPDYWFEDTICIYMIYPKCKKVATIEDILYEYRLNQEGITSTSRGDVRSLDALWVTRHILSDARQSGIPWGQALYESFLHDLCVNYTRFSSLKSPTIHLNTFIVSCALREQYFHHFHTNDSKLKPLELALIQGDYGAYILYGKCYL